jgi:hypothetical protein
VSQDTGATGAGLATENRVSEVVHEETEGGGCVEEVQVIPLRGEKVHQSMFVRIKKLGGKVRKLVRGVRASLPSIGVQSEEGVKVQIEVVNSQDATVGLRSKLFDCCLLALTLN